MKKSLLLYMIAFITLLILSVFENIQLYIELNDLAKKFPEVEFWSIGKNMVCIPVFVLVVIYFVILLQTIQTNGFHLENSTSNISRQKSQKRYLFQLLTVLVTIIMTIRLLTILTHAVGTLYKEPQAI